MIIRRLLTGCLMLAVFPASAQLTYLAENFDVACATGVDPSPPGWLVVNPIASTAVQGAWHCTAYNGRKNAAGSTTPGIFCTGVFGSAYHLDTSYLVTPKIDISGYSDSVYLRFDSKTEILHLGGKLDALISPSDSLTSSYSPANPYTSITDSLMPLFSNGDSTDWVTHQANITRFKGKPFYIVFRYTSFDTSGNIWYLDNINTTTSRLQVPVVIPRNMPLDITVSGSSSIVSVSFFATQAGLYRLCVYDVLGKMLQQKVVNAFSGHQNVTLNDLDLHPGIYFVRIGNDNIFGNAKFVIR